MISLQLVTPENIVYSDNVARVTIPTRAGEITVLPKHTPLVSLLVPGELIVQKTDGERIYFAVSGGFVEIRPDNKIILLADTAERAEQIDKVRAEEARARAEEMLKRAENSEDDEEYARFLALVHKEIVRIKVAERRQKKR